MFYMPYKTINYYVCCALVYNMSDYKIFYENIITTDSIHYVESEDKDFSSLSMLSSVSN